MVSEIARPGLRLRLVTQEDAHFIHGLRTDPAYNQHLSPVTGTAEDQHAWIVAYKAREAAGEELYYIIERFDGRPCGTVRLYGITQENFTWGSWILNADKSPKAALESAILSFSVGFDELGLKRAYIDVQTENAKAIRFYRRFGMVETRADSQSAG
ncbi:MAG: GNAT family N-acetyltransferase [Roseovarius sp.]|nr:GNAT family N-acetyltransferase [Roseovarius sp.]